MPSNPVWPLPGTYLSCPFAHYDELLLLRYIRKVGVGCPGLSTLPPTPTGMDSGTMVAAADDSRWAGWVLSTLHHTLSHVGLAASGHNTRTAHAYRKPERVEKSVCCLVPAAEAQGTVLPL